MISFLRAPLTTCLAVVLTAAHIGATAAATSTAATSTAGAPTAAASDSLAAAAAGAGSGAPSPATPPTGSGSPPGEAAVDGAAVPVVDGFAVCHVPGGVGTRTSTFAYHWEGVSFRSQVWERGPDAAGAYAVDLTVKVLRGPGLTDIGALRTFLAGYHEQDPAGWREIEPGRAYLRPGAVFRFVEPGVATEVSLESARFPEPELLAAAAALRPVQEPSGSGELACAQ